MKEDRRLTPKGFSTSEVSRRIEEIDALRGRPITRLAFDGRLSADEMAMLREFRGGKRTLHDALRVSEGDSILKGK